MSPCEVVMVAFSFCAAVMHIGCGPMNSWGAICVDVAQFARAAGTTGSMACLISNPPPATAAIKTAITKSASHA